MIKNLFFLSKGDNCSQGERGFGNQGIDMFY